MNGTKNRAQTREISVLLPCYLGEWVKRRFGVPARFPARSYENALLARHIARRPAGVAVKVVRLDGTDTMGVSAAADGNGMIVRIEVPVIHARPWEVYNYLPSRGRGLLCGGLDALFRLDLWQSMLPHLGRPGLLRALDVWCRDAGITLDNFGAVKQKFYRMRRDYERSGVMLGKKYEKHLKD